MPSLLDLLNVDPNFNYYNGGLGNFTQKSLGYGDDRPGGGNSGQPYIIRNYDEKWSPSNFDDGTMRLGIVGATERSLADVERITKFFADEPRGLIFITKQVGLALSNPRLEQRIQNPDVPSPTDLAGVVSSINNAIGPTRIYNLGINTLAQVGASAFGGHFYRNGLSPVMSDDDKYLSIVSANNDVNATMVSQSSGNRLLRLEASLFDSNVLTIDSYQGGPGSVYGIGTTTIAKSSTDTLSDNAADTRIGTDGFVPFTLKDLVTIGRDGTIIRSIPTQPNIQYPSRDQLMQGTTQIPTISPGSAVVNQVAYNVKYQDFRQIKNALYRTNLPFSDYFNNNISTRIRRGNPGTPGLDRSKYWEPLNGTQELINKLSLFYSQAPPQVDSQIFDLNSGESVVPSSVRDIIKFRIESIDNDNPSYSVWMVFPALLVNGFSDSWVPEHDAYKYTGRGEKFYVYNGYVRQISTVFMIAAQTRQEMKPLYQKLNYLMSTITPDYNKANKMRGSITKLTIGDYIYRQPGIITSLNVEVEVDYPWEIALDEPEGGVDSDMHEVPMVLKVSLSFIPFQDFLPRKSASSPFISVDGRRSPTDVSGSVAKNNWFADNGITNDAGGTKYTLLQDKINSNTLRKTTPVQNITPANNNNNGGQIDVAGTFNSD